MRMHQSPPGRRLETCPSPYLLRLSDRRAKPTHSAQANQMSTCSAMASASSTSIVPNIKGSTPMLSTPLADEPAVVPRRHALTCAPPPDKQELAGLLARQADVIADRLPGLLGHLETNGTTGLLLPHCGAVGGVAVRSN